MCPALFSQEFDLLVVVVVSVIGNSGSIQITHKHQFTKYTAHTAALNA